MFDETPSLQAIHVRYCAMTGLSQDLTNGAMFFWRSFLARGYTASDLELVVRHLQRKIPERWKQLPVLRLNRLIGDLDYFEEDLAEARALSRVPRPNPARSAVLRATGRLVQKPADTVRTPEQIMAGDAALKEFLALRDNL